MKQSKSGAPFIGTCSFHWCPTDMVSIFPLVRAYISMGWIATEHGLYIQPMLQAQKQYLGFDDYFSDMKKRRIDVVACINQSPVWLNEIPHWDRANDHPPIRPNLSRTDPDSYNEYANIWFNIVARYGRKKWGSDPRLRVDPAPPRWDGDGTQEIKTGMKLLKYVEVGNEWDKWWKIGTPEDGQYMKPAELGALLVSCYRAIREADPTMKIVMPGLTNYNLPYILEMLDWIIDNDYPIPFDVVNVHHYSSTGNLAGVHPPNWPINSACSPESDRDFQSINGVITLAKKSGRKVWVTEFGYDTTPNSPNYPHPFQDPVLSQAQWIMRSILEYMAAGVERCYLFNFNDEPGSAAGGQFLSSGVVSNEGTGFNPKDSYYLLKNMINHLAGTTFNKRSQSDDGTQIMQFSGSGKSVLVYWLPTSTGATLQNSWGLVTETPQFKVQKILKSIPGTAAEKVLNKS